MKTGFIGLGTMGLPMCQNLLTKKVQLGVFSTDVAKAKDLSLKGALAFHSVEELSNWAEAVLIMVPDDAAVSSIIQKCATPGKIIVNMSTISVELAKKLSFEAQKGGWEFINAPVSGSKRQAIEAQLIILYGGKKEMLQKVEHLFSAMGKSVMEAGAPENSAKLKLLVNFLMAGMLEGLAESLALAKKLGISQDILLKTVEEGALNCGLFRIKGKNMVEGDFEPAFATKYILKDLRYLKQAAAEAGQSIKSNIIELYDQSDKRNHELDLSAVYKLLSA